VRLRGHAALIPFGLRMCAPVLLQFAPTPRRRKFLPRIFQGEDFWCQGYSEPGSGSDLASLKTRAVRQGDGHYIVTARRSGRPCPARRLDLLPRADRRHRQAAGRHLVPAHRHEDARHQRAADRLMVSFVL